MVESEPPTACDAGRHHDAARAAAFVSGLVAMLLVPGSPAPPSAPQEGAFVWVFAPPIAMADLPPGLIVISHNGTCMGSPDPVLEVASITCHTSNLGVVETLACWHVQACPAWLVEPQTEGPRLAVAGNDTAKLAIYAFRGDGSLAASNAPPAERARFSQASGYRSIPDAWWYLGAGAQPPGTQLIPGAFASALDACWPKMVGLPVGGVATCQATTSFGRFYVTLRVDGLRAV